MATKKTTAKNTAKNTAKKSAPKSATKPAKKTSSPRAPKSEASKAPAVPAWHKAPDSTRAWKKLSALAKRGRSAQLRAMFAKDRTRGTKFSADALGMHLDYAKNLIDSEILDALFA